MQDNSYVVPLVVLAWPLVDTGELNKLYEAIAVLLCEEYDLLILARRDEQDQILERLDLLDVPESAIHFLEMESVFINVAAVFRLDVIANGDGSEAVDLRIIEEGKKTRSQFKLYSGDIEFIHASQKILVPVYEEDRQEEILMDIAQEFPLQEIVAFNCEVLKLHSLKLSDLILFAND